MVFFGMTATGKSFLSSLWASRRGYPRFNTDVLRKTIIAGNGERPDRNVRGIERGIYTPEISRRTYDCLLQLAFEALQQGHQGVILDGSFQKACERERVRKRFAGLAEVRFVQCTCSEAVVRARLGQRLQDPSAVSDGSLEVYLHQCQHFEAPEEIPAAQLLKLDTSGPLEYLIELLERFLHRPLADRNPHG